MEITDTIGYNDRLFKKGIRRDIHLARFIWMENKLKKRKYPHSTVIELGCFDAKSINFLHALPERYVGIDANWEGGLDAARKDWPKYEFIESNNPSKLDNIKASFELGISQETFEHIPPNLVPEYLKKLASLISGYFLITVPNEIGVLFFLKHLVKICMRSGDSYTFMETIYETLGKTNRVKRGDCSHKGFNYHWLINQVSKYFDIVKVEGIPFTFMPLWIGFNIGIIAKSK